MARVPASEATRKRIEAMISGEGEGVDKSELVRAAARLIVEEVLEEEVTDALGRDFYEHGAKSGSGYRNGYTDRGSEHHGPYNSRFLDQERRGVRCQRRRTHGAPQSKS